MAVGPDNCAFVAIKLKMTPRRLSMVLTTLQYALPLVTDQPRYGRWYRDPQDGERHSAAPGSPCPPPARRPKAPYRLSTDRYRSCPVHCLPRDIRRAVGGVPTSVKQGEFGFAGVFAREQPMIVHHIEHAGHNTSLFRSKGLSRLRIDV